MAQQQADFAEKQRLLQQRQAAAALESSEGANADNERAIQGLQRKVRPPRIVQTYSNCRAASQHFSADEDTAAKGRTRFRPGSKNWNQLSSIPGCR